MKTPPASSRTCCDGKTPCHVCCDCCPHPSAPARPALAACPFCEYEKPAMAMSMNMAGTLYFVSCSRCDAHGPWQTLRDAAIAAWNRRTPAPQPAPEIPERLLDVLSRWLWDVDWEHCLPESRDEVIEAAKEVLEAVRG